MTSETPSENEFPCFAQSLYDLQIMYSSGCSLLARLADGKASLACLTETDQITCDVRDLTSTFTALCDAYIVCKTPLQKEHHLQVHCVSRSRDNGGELLFLRHAPHALLALRS